MSIKDEYLNFRNSMGLKTINFKDRVILQNFIKKNLQEIWREKPNFSNAGLLSNYMTRYAIGFAYYDCQPTPFCQQRCYGLPIAGMHDYYMLRLGVITSESFKNADYRFINILKNKLKSLNLKCLKIGHWGDATIEQVPNIVNMVKDLENTKFWWYTRKKEIAAAANEHELPNLKAYLSLDPSTEYPSSDEYPFGITYLFGDGLCHENHERIIKDNRLVAIFALKRRKFIEAPELYGLASHPKICKEKDLTTKLGAKANEICLACSGRCNYS
jgi:uncharacterized protein YfkK (UPF0435 family)